jgi:hypothetical protein
MRTSRDVKISRGALLDDNDFILVPKPDGAGNDTLRIQLTWSKEPSDLDAHLWLPPTGPAHISKDYPGTLGPPPVEGASLILMSDIGFGPELITLDNLHSGTYTYAVRVNNHANGLLISGARVEVYYYDADAVPPTSLRIKSFKVPTTGTGNWWNVFTFDGDFPTVIHEVNQIQSSSPAPYVDP